MSFRDIDVDTIEDDCFTEADYLAPDAIPAWTAESAQAAASETASQVRLLIQRGDVDGALVKALSNPVYGHQSELDAAKATCARAVLDVLSASKTADAARLVGLLSFEQRDLLMKHLYRAFAHPEGVNCGSLLSWHEKLVEVTGHGAILRVLTDRRTV